MRSLGSLLARAVAAVVASALLLPSTLAVWVRTVPADAVGERSLDAPAPVTDE